MPTKLIFFNSSLKRERYRKIFEIICHLQKHYKRVINYLASNLFLYLKSIKASLPYDIIIDPCNICMLKCPLCPTGQQDPSREKTIMKFDLFKKVIDEIGEYIIFVNFTNWGEPLLNKNLYRMITYCKKVKHIPLVRFDTNLTVKLTDNEWEKLLTSGLDVLTASIDGLTQEVYEKYRRGGDINIVLNNLEKLISKKKQLKLSNPFIIWQFLVFKHNMFQIPEVIKFAKEIGVDAIKIASARVSTGIDIFTPLKVSFELSKDYLPEPGSYWSLYSKDLKKKSFKKNCDWLWKRIVINPDGSVSPCCAYYPQRYDFGTIRDKTIKELYNSSKYKKARLCVKNKAYAQELLRNEDFVCAKCILLNSFVDVSSGEKTLTGSKSS